jgi:DtxR family transcriptional regulator, Mn-dependent transcriptional regulator
MLPSSTVENYLKAIHLGVGRLEGQRLLPMGQLAASLGVAPGTATTMVKTLSESGLVEYEPYSGVALTPAGEKLASLVVRRHRLIELFLVQVLGFGWDEVHDEAEQLEHVVSERLVERIDEMLGRPATDPHGDPIPDSDGLLKPQEAQNLLTCPLGMPVTVARVIDQDKMFLRFIEQHNLKPGESIEVEDRDAASDSVRVRGKNDQRITIGTRAASKLLVNVSRALGLVIALAAPAQAQAQDTPAVTGSSRPWEITDNSFLVEEAFNQEAGIFQNIFGIHVGSDGDWDSAFTQEWPLASRTHQISYTLGYSGAGGGSGFGDAFIHYRWQARDETGRGPAFSPRVSLILPTGNASRGRGNGNPGWELNLPFSKQHGDVYLHWNAGLTHLPSAEGDGAEHNLVTPRVAASGIWRVRPMLNVMLEAVAQWAEEIVETSTLRTRAVTILPGLRTGWNLGDAQVIVGVGVPITFSAGDTSAGGFGYFSYELPFTPRP